MVSETTVVIYASPEVQIIEKAEKSIFLKTEEQLNKWRTGNANDKDIAAYYAWLNDFVRTTYSDELGVDYKN